jgi:protein phosphatase
VKGLAVALQGLPETRSHFRWTSAARSHVGLVREINEDACLDRAERGLWAVADGMGGHSVGDFASGMVIEALSDAPSPGSLESLVADARRRLEAVNQKLRAEARLRKAQMIGSTVVALLAHDRYCACLWAGDSRIYLYRNGRLRLLTRDHTHAEELKSRGVVATEDVLHRAVRHGITRAVGAVDRLDLDAEIVEVIDGDIFLLCSDGLSNAASTQEIVSALLPGNCRRAADTLIEVALERGGHDNISAVVVCAEDLDSSDRTMFNPAL